MSIALVTGGSRGIGRAVVEEFAQAGYQVAFTFANNQDAAGQLVSNLKKQGWQAAAYEADVRGFQRAEEVVKEVESNLGPITVLVNNAGIRRDGALHRMTPAAWAEVIETNLTGTFNYSRLAVPGMLRTGGAIINITSASGISGMSGQTNYSASKAGVIGFTKALAKEIARFGIRVNAIAPGFIETDMTAGLDADLKKKLYAAIPLRHPGTPQQVARLAWFLATDGSYITGQVYAVDGGLT